MIKQKSPKVQISNSVLKQSETNLQGEYVQIHGDKYYMIKNYDAMEPFLMSIVSGSNHWLYISSTGGLTAGRISADQALFPYYTEDKLTENSDNTGHKAVFLVRSGQSTFFWEPFSGRYKGIYQINRNIYKNEAGTAVIFEEINHDLGLSYQYAWRSGDEFGFIKTSWLQNLKGSPCSLELVDGFQNILPANASASVQNSMSCLLDAYKRNELNLETGLAIFALNAALTDRPEPNESLQATIAWQMGLDPSGYLLSSTQLDRFRAGMENETETEVRGRKGAYFVHANLELAPAEEQSWHLIADVGQDSATIVRLVKKIKQGRQQLSEAILKDIKTNDETLEKIVNSADGLQVSSATSRTTHHFTNVMFNAMRGGTFTDQYRLQTQDFIKFLMRHNHLLAEQANESLSDLPAQMNIWDLQAYMEASHLDGLVHLVHSYLPLMFSRRHGDPSRPWNQFKINIKKADGSLQLGYEGNWRDIFQNWEALAYSFPEYVENMICTFLNATTADGYNPYRITHNGIEWEVPDKKNPWANIGYWSDHQIIYLQKLMEISARVHPGKLQDFLSRPIFTYANVPYRIKPYDNLLNDPNNSIDFDWALDGEIGSFIPAHGTDARLVHSREGKLLHANLAEKLLTLILAKMVNFVPEGGIWMNTQRPEWNDANNALVGKGLTVVTLSYLRRTIQFCIELFGSSKIDTIQIRSEVHALHEKVFQILRNFLSGLDGSFTDEQRRKMMDELGNAGSDYRWNFYSQGFQEKFSEVPISELVAFLQLMQGYIEHTLRANRRSDDLYHAYNILHLGNDTASISYLHEMLEGQVAILSSGLLSGEESLRLLQNLRNGPMYNPKQHSYLLYPDRDLPGFMQKNHISPEQVANLRLVAELLKANDHTLFVRDVEGQFHFNSSIRNIKDVDSALENLGKKSFFSDLVDAEQEPIKALFEHIFHHAEFTGRSGTFFAYEGLGSIFWHMVAKLLLAVQETIFRTRDEPTTSALIERYDDIRSGLGFNKSPKEYGAFPTDPYSHTPKNRGAQQPGMTGTVKEEILTRQRELGYSIMDGRITFDFLLLDKKEMLDAPFTFTYWGVDGQLSKMDLPSGSLSFFICQVPIILQTSSIPCMTVYRSDGSFSQIDGNVLDLENSRHIFKRDGIIHHLIVAF